MESLWSMPPLTVGVQLSVGLGLLLAVGYIIYRTCRPFQVLKRLGIKGPKPTFFFGNYLELKKLGWLKFSEQLHEEYGPICGFYIGHQPRVIVADLEMIKQITMAGEYELFLHRPLPASTMAYTAAGRPRPLSTQEGNEWKRLRKVWSPIFSAMKTKTFVPHMRKVCDSLMKKFAECASSEKSVDVHKIFGMFTIQTIMACGFGREVDLLQGEADFLAETVEEVFLVTKTASLDDMDFFLGNFPFIEPLIGLFFYKTRAGSALKKLTETVESLVNSRGERGESGHGGEFKDMLQMMFDKHGGERLTNGEITTNAVDFILGGYETTANTLAFTAYLTALNPSVQERLRSEIEEYFDNNPDSTLYDAAMEIKYLDMVVNEVLRIFPPGPRLLRRALKTTELNGVTIPKGTVIYIPLYLFHHHPQYWPDPEKFDPERFSPEEKAKRPRIVHMPFGLGSLQCIGMRFGLLEAKVGLIEVLKKYKFVQAPDTEIPIQKTVGITLNPKNGVVLKILPRD